VRRGRRGAPVVAGGPALVFLRLLALLALLGACGGTSATASGAHLRSPRLVMVDASTGYAVWPSGVRWIVLATTDGWRTVEDRTPVAVPTDGGLVLAATDSRVAVGVLPHEQLAVSPILQTAPAPVSWQPSQLPSALLAAPGSLALAPRATWAVLADGRTVVSASLGSDIWSTAVTAGELDSGGELTLTGVDFTGGRTGTGFLTARGPATRPVLFVSTDSGGSWHPARLPAVSGSDGGTATALPPCLVGSTWMAPIVSGGRLRVFTSADPAGPWAAGPALPATTEPAVACGPDRIWVATGHGSGGDVHTATPGGAWVLAGRVDGAVTSLAVVSSREAFATLDGPARLETLRLGATLTATKAPLPDWVATIGGTAMRN
jgi:hypothetical protein